MTVYSKTQFSLPVLLMTTAWLIGVVLMFLGNPEVVFKFIFGTIFIVNVLILLLMPSMTITVDDKHVTWKLGVGLHSGKFPLGKINMVEVVEDVNHFGLGARVTSRGDLFIVGGNKAVRLHIKTPWKKDKIVELGTPEPEVLKDVIEVQAGIKAPSEDHLLGEEKKGELVLDNAPEPVEQRVTTGKRNRI